MMGALYMGTLHFILLFYVLKKWSRPKPILIYVSSLDAMSEVFFFFSKHLLIFILASLAVVSSGSLHNRDCTLDSLFEGYICACGQKLKFIYGLKYLKVLEVSVDYCGCFSYSFFSCLLTFSLLSLRILLLTLFVILPFLMFFKSVSTIGNNRYHSKWSVALIGYLIKTIYFLFLMGH